MDTVTFVATPAVDDRMLLLFAVISAICYSSVYYISNKVFSKHRLVVYALTAGLGLGLSGLINFVIYTLLI